MMILIIVLMGSAIAFAYPEKEFDSVQRAKARVFLDRLASGAVDYEKFADKGLLAKETESERTLSQARDKVLYPGPNLTGFPNDAIKGMYDQLDDLIARVKTSNPFPPSAQASFPDMYSIKKEIPPGAVILEYYLEKDRGRLFILPDRGPMEIIPLEIPRDSLKVLVDVYNGEIHYGAKPETLRMKGMELSERLGLNAARKHLDGKKLLIIAPHGILHKLPFHTLPLQNGKLLIESYQMIYAPSATAWYNMKFRQAGKVRGVDGLVFAIEEEGIESPSEMLRRCMKPGKTLVNKDFTMESFLRDAPNADRLHIRDPFSVIEEKYPRFSQFFTWREAVYYYEIEKVGLKPSLVALDFSGSAAGANTPGDDVESFCRQFLTSGVDTVVGNLDPEPSKCYHTFWKEFYRVIEKGEKPVSAYRKAILECMRNDPPAKWSRFVIMGTGD